MVQAAVAIVLFTVSLLEIQIHPSSFFNLELELMGFVWIAHVGVNRFFVVKILKLCHWWILTIIPKEGRGKKSVEFDK